MAMVRVISGPMGDLYSRLKQIKGRRGTAAGIGNAAGSGAAAGSQATTGSGAAAGSPAGTGNAAGSSPRSPDTAGIRPPPGPGWRPVVTGTGAASGVFFRQVSYPYDANRYGDAFDPDGRWRSLSSITRRPPGRTPVFLDIETSGLSTGAGSVAFLIGIGVPRGSATEATDGKDATAATETPDGKDASAATETPVAAETTDATTAQATTAATNPEGSQRIAAIEVTQFFLSDMGSEGAQIDTFLAHLAAIPDPMYVTYNGASFDLPVLRSRSVMQRLRFPEHPHLDLLPLVRRLYAPRIGACTLGSVESRVLRRPRTDDTPGSEAPERFLTFLRTGDYGVVAPVFEHHLRDIAHLAEVALTVNGALNGSGYPGDNGASGVGSPVGAAPLDPDPIGLARLLVERGGPDATHRALELFEAEYLATAERVRRVRTFAARRGVTGLRSDRPGGSPGVAGTGGPPRPGFASRYPENWIRVRELLLATLRRAGEERRYREVVEELYRELDRREDLIRFTKILEHRVGDYDTALREIERWCTRHRWDPELRHRYRRLSNRNDLRKDR
ncbi:MAG: ribonuclease H-like domain-containing protein [Alkalispirochaeta sp.]